MPSENQSNAGGTDYANEYGKMLHKSDATVAALIHGIRRPEECQRYLEAEVNGQKRKDVIGALNRKMKELEVPDE